MSGGWNRDVDRARDGPAQRHRHAADTASDRAAADRGAVSEIKSLFSEASRRTYAEQDRAEREAQTRRIRELLGPGE